jgi:hypothetical protein
MRVKSALLIPLAVFWLAACGKNYSSASNNSNASNEQNSSSSVGADSAVCSSTYPSCGSQQNGSCSLTFQGQVYSGSCSIIGPPRVGGGQPVYCVPNGCMIPL